MTPDTRVQSEKAGAYAWYVVFALALCQALAAMDARLPYILVEALKRDLDLTDTQIGLITGPAFSLSYALFAIPIAKLSDVKNRTVIIGGAVIVWSAFTACGGLAKGFATFALARVGVAFGEAALTPAAHSLISNYLPQAARAKGIALYAFGFAMGSFIALALGGYIGDRFGWQMAFFIIGGAGVAFSLLVFFTVREPPREAPARDSSLPKGNIASLFGNPVIAHTILGALALGFSVGALGSWGPAYVMRSFGLSATQTGASYGAVVGLLAMIGILAGGFIGSWLSNRSPHYALRMLAIVFFVTLFTQLGALFADNYVLFLVLIAITSLLSAFYMGPTHAAIQSMVDPSARSFASAVTVFCINGLGIAFGAFFVGLLSDTLAPSLGGESLRWALITVTICKLWSAIHYWQASRHLQRLAPA
jgi:predicted MFS family arabinose efflux permease